MKFESLLLIVFNITQLYSADNFNNININNFSIINDNQLDQINNNILSEIDKPIEQEMNTIYDKLNDVNNIIRKFVLLIFNPDKLYSIIMINDINILNKINALLELDFVKNYFILNGIDSVSLEMKINKYKQSFIDTNDEFKYNAAYISEVNLKWFKTKYYTKFRKFYTNINKLINNIKEKAENLNRYLHSMPGNDIRKVKHQILNKILEYLEKYKANSEKLLNNAENDCIEVLKKISNKPLHELLNIDKDFFKNILDEIQNTTGNEQAENIFKFIFTGTRAFGALLQCNDNDILNTIYEILKLKIVNKCTAETKHFYNDIYRDFTKKINTTYKRNVMIQDFDEYKMFVNDFFKIKLEYYNFLIEMFLNTLENNTMEETSLQKIICRKISYHLCQWVNFFDKGLGKNNEKLEEDFIKIFKLNKY